MRWLCKQCTKRKLVRHVASKDETAVFFVGDKGNASFEVEGYLDYCVEPGLLGILITLPGWCYWGAQMPSGSMCVA